MEDGRKNNGGARTGSGRKSKSEELGLPALIDNCVTAEKQEGLIRLLFNQAMDGSFKHMQLFLAYKFGRPSQLVDLTTKGGPIDKHEVVFVDFSVSES